MKQAVYAGDKVFEIRDVPVPEPGEGEVLVKVDYCGICGTDVHGFMYDTCLLYTSPSPRDGLLSRMPSSA